MSQVNHEVTGTALIEKRRKTFSRKSIKLINIDREGDLTLELGVTLSHAGDQNDFLSEKAPNPATLDLLSFRGKIDEQDLVILDQGKQIKYGSGLAFLA